MPGQRRRKDDPPGLSRKYPHGTKALTESRSDLASSAPSRRTPVGVPTSQDAQVSKGSIRQPESPTGLGSSDRHDSRARLEFHRTAHSFPDYGTVKGAVRMPPPSSRIKSLAPATHFNTLDSGSAGREPRHQETTRASSALPKPPPMKRPRPSNSTAPFRPPSEDIVESEQDAKSRTDQHGSQASFAHSVSPGLYEFQSVEASARSPSRSNRRSRRANVNRPNGGSFTRPNSARSESIEDFDELAPPPKLAPHLQRTARLISTVGPNPRICDPADEHILGRPQPKKQSNGLNRGKKRSSHEMTADGGELVTELDGNRASEVLPVLETGESARPSAPSLSRRGDLTPTKWIKKSNPGNATGILVAGAVCQPNLRYCHVDEQSQTLLKPQGAELRAFKIDGSLAGSFDWLKITKKAKSLHFHPNCSFLRISQATERTSSTQIGALLMLKLTSVADALHVADWARRNLNIKIVEESESDKLIQTFDNQDQLVTQANGRESAMRKSIEVLPRPPRAVEEPVTRTPSVLDSLPAESRTPIRHQMQVSAQPPSSSRAQPPKAVPPPVARPVRAGRGAEQTQQDVPPMFRRWSEEHPQWAEKWKMPLVFHRTTVDKEDVARLDDGQLLNDNIIGFGLKYLFDKLGSRHPDLNKRVYVHNSFFYEKLKSGRGINYDGVKNWTAKVDLLSYDYIIVPVNEHYHWWVAIICNPGKLDPDFGNDAGDAAEPCKTGEVKHGGDSTDVEMTDVPEKQPLQPPRPNKTDDQTSQGLGFVKSDIVDLVSDDKITSIDLTSSRAGANQGKKSGASSKRYNLGDPRIITLDSMGNNHAIAITHLKKYLIAEFEHKRNKTITQVPRDLGFKAVNIPEQNNFCDCGIYLLGYIQEFVVDPDRFIRTLLQQEHPEWDFDASALRKLWRDTILIEHETYQGAQLAAKQQKRGSRVAACTSKRSAEPSGQLSGSSREATTEPNSKLGDVKASSNPPSTRASATPAKSAAHEANDSDVEPLSRDPQEHPASVNGQSPQRQPSHSESLDDVALLSANPENKVLPSIEPIEVVDDPLPLSRNSPVFIRKLSAESPASTAGRGPPATEVKPRAFYGSAPKRPSQSSPLRGQSQHGGSARKGAPPYTETRFVASYDDDYGPVVQTARLVRQSDTIDLTD
ncbi:hypothetical protein VTK26DRAFT_6599 [Humicola hyalothermophila]